jgi:deoxyribodipyrimidine photo-lyase
MYIYICEISKMAEKIGLFLYHRDLRIVDNKALLRASRECDKLYTAFIFTPEQATNANKFKSKNAVQFMIESLTDLADELREMNGDLISLYGDPVKMTAYLIERLRINAVYFNRDYTPYALRRDAETMQLCDKRHIQCLTENDYYLQEPGTILNGGGDFYRQFTPFYQKHLLTDVDTPGKTNKKPFSKFTGHLEHKITLKHAFDKFVGTENRAIAVRGGRHRGVATLRTAMTHLGTYVETRDVMSEDTSYLSAYIKFGCVSIREVYFAFKRKYSLHHEFIRQLIWRDFYAHNLFGYPQTLGELFSAALSRIRWKQNDVYLDAWKDGKTGFPIVDAGMRQLNETGYMHNRARMMVATCLTKILMLDWREGERYFAQQLTDYDVASNSGNWQAIVGGGYYTMPWFRVMSPWVQSKEYDKDALYIKTWVKELKDVAPKDIHKWYKTHSLEEYASIRYPKPMVNYSKQKEVFMELYQKAFDA